MSTDNSEKIEISCAKIACNKKHDCPDCRACLWCSDSKCAMCLRTRPKQKQPKITKQS